MSFLIKWIKRLLFIWKVKKTKEDRTQHIKQLEKELGIIEERKSKYGCTVKETSAALSNAFCHEIAKKENEIITRGFEGFDLGQQISIDGTNIEQVNNIPGCRLKSNPISMTNQDSPYITTVPGRPYIPDVHITGLYSSSLNGVNYLRDICGDHKLHTISITDIDNVVHFYEGYIVDFIITSRNNLIRYSALLMITKSVFTPSDEYFNHLKWMEGINIPVQLP